MFAYPLAVGPTLTRVLQSGLTGEPVVFVHGTATRADRFVHNLDAIAEAGFRAFAIDLPGHGLASKDPTFDHSVPGYTRFLAEFIDILGAEKVTLVGTSLGGHVVARYAADHSDRVKALVLAGSMGLVPLGEDAQRMIQRGASMQARDQIAGKLRRVIFDPDLVTENFIEEEFRINNSAGAAACFEKLGAYIGGQLDNDVVGAQLDAFAGRFPVLLVWGADDKTVSPDIGKRANEAIRNSRFITIENAAHTVYFEQPATFNRMLVEAIAGR